jgi:hypothetical protein
MVVYVLFLDEIEVDYQKQVKGHIIKYS